MGQRVVIHVGCPKTGSTGIQGQLFANADLLARRGILYPAPRHDEHFFAAIDLMDLPWPEPAATQRIGAWDRMVEVVRETNLTTLISHELLARATPAHIQRAVESLGNAKVSVVITARDLGRVIPAEYQEHVKYRNPMKFGEFLQRLQDPDVQDHAGEWARLTWLVQDVPALARRWADAVGEDQVTIVTVPGRGAPRDELMKRFAQAVGFDILGFRSGVATENRSLGAAEVEVLRRFNEAQAAGISEHAYQLFARNRLVRGLERSETSAPALSLTSQDYPWVRDRSQQWVDALGQAGYRVVGDLDDLLPTEPPADTEHPDEIGVDRLFETALEILARSANDYSELDRLKVRQEVEIAKLDWEANNPVEILKRRTVARLESGVAGRGVLSVWRKRPGYVAPEQAE